MVGRSIGIFGGTVIRIAICGRLAVAAMSFVAASSFAEGNADEGKKYFEMQCIACHSAETDDGGGAQGPSLIGVLGRAVGSDKEFSYTKELRDSKLVWDVATLDRFLAAPDKVVPGTMMVIAVPEQSDRDNLVAYFKRVAGANKSASQVGSSPTRVAVLDAQFDAAARKL
jgi:cytochrome c